MSNELIQYEDHIFSQVSDSYSQITKNIADTQNMLDDLKAIAKEKDNIISCLENDKQALKLENNSLKSENKKQCEIIANYEKNLAFFESVKIDSVRLADLISEKETELVSLKEQKEKFEKEKTNILSENQKLKSDLDNKKRELSDKQHEYDSFVDNQRKNVDGLNLKIQTLTTENSSLTAKLNNAENKSKELEERNNSSAVQINDLRKKIEELSIKLQDMACKSSGDENDISIDNSSEIERYVSENEMLRLQIEELNKDIKWLVGYANGTDRKIKSYFTGHQKELSEHHDWLCNKPKDDTYKKFFESSLEEKSENTNMTKTSPKREKGMA